MLSLVRKHSDFATSKNTGYKEHYRRSQHTAAAASNLHSRQIQKEIFF